MPFLRLRTRRVQLAWLACVVAIFAIVTGAPVRTAFAQTLTLDAGAAPGAGSRSLTRPSLTLDAGLGDAGAAPGAPSSTPAPAATGDAGPPSGEPGTDVAGGNVPV